MEKPIFIFAAGWRSGSTLLQRLITASGEALVWGEPGGGFGCLADATERYEQMLDPDGRAFKHGLGGKGARQFQQFLEAGPQGVHKWIACMNPPMSRIQEAFSGLLHQTYALPANELGYERWGVKEVQAEEPSIRWLNTLYPKGKFVFLVRDPRACILSIKRRHWMDRKYRLAGLAFYTQQWRRIAGQFAELDFGFKVRYEDLISDQAELDRLSEYLEIRSLPSIEFIQESAADWKADREAKLRVWERWYVESVAKPQMKAWGYL